MEGMEGMEGSKSRAEMNRKVQNARERLLSGHKKERQLERQRERQRRSSEALSDQSEDGLDEDGLLNEMIAERFRHEARELEEEVSYVMTLRNVRRDYVMHLVRDRGTLPGRGAR